MEHTGPPLDYLLTCSEAGLESFEVSRLNRIANLRRELRDVLDEWMDAEVSARVARWLLECKRAESCAADGPALPPPVSLLLGTHAASFLPPLPGVDDWRSELNGQALGPTPTAGDHSAVRAQYAVSLPAHHPAPPNGEHATDLRRLERHARRTTEARDPRLPHGRPRQESRDRRGMLSCAPPAARPITPLRPAPPVRARLKPPMLRHRRLPPAS